MSCLRVRPVNSNFLGESVYSPNPPDSIDGVRLVFGYLATLFVGGVCRVRPPVLLAR